ncbi:CHAP domain-containing protein [Candidatus Saccharibacteria bacterium]|nr:CHAP domain-containing protein [Candidatus Saccharibacteria bacterium]
MKAYAKIADVRSKKQKMKQIKQKMGTGSISLSSRQGVFALSFVFLTAFLLAGFSIVSADQYDAKIKELEQQNDKKEAVTAQLGAEASSLSEVISKLQAEIDAKQATISQYQNDVEQLKVEIAAAEKELAKQKDLLRQTIKAIYIEGDISTLEMLASSDDLTDFFDKQQYRDTVQDKVKSTLDKITQLKLDLNTKKNKIEKLIADQKRQKAEIVSKRSEKDRLLSLNVNEQNKLESEIQANNVKVAELRRQQAIENAKHGSGVIAGDPSKGGYPAKWANAPQDSLVDTWGMYNRECVSYAAWKVYQSGRYMPYWGGRGNANRWPHNTSNKGKTPRVGAVAIAYWGYYGHAMYVEAISGNRVYVSQYHYGVRGEYSEMWVNTSEIDWFLYF